MIRHDGALFPSKPSFVSGKNVIGESWRHRNCGNDHTRPWSHQDFQMGSFIAKGGFGSVFRARIRRPTLGHGRDEEIALKKISKKAVMEREKKGRRAILLLRRETNIQSNLNHQHIIRLFGFYETPTSLTLVMELGSRGDIRSYLYNSKKRGNHDLSLVRRVLLQTSQALSYLEQSLVAHRDIKPENIVLNENLDAKLTDFGWAVWCRPSQWHQTFCGTAEYCPPEIATIRCYDPRFIDRWMLGVLIVELTVGATPFAPQEEDVDDECYETIALANVNAFGSVDQLNLPHDVKNLVAQLLVVDPYSRRSAQWVTRHPFFGVQEIPPTSLPMEAHCRRLFQGEGCR